MPRRERILSAPYLDEWRDALLAAVGERMREFRTLAGLSLREFAERIDTHESQISRLEKGRANVTVVFLDRVAHGLGVDVHELLVPAEKSDVLARGVVEPEPAAARPRRRQSKRAVWVKERDRSELLPAIGARIREFRDLQGLSLSVFAGLIDMDPTAISRVERGKHNLTLAFADRIARGLRVELHELFVPVEKSDILPRERPAAKPGGRARTEGGHRGA